MNKSSIQQELQTAEKYSNDTSEKIKGTINRLKNEGNIFLDVFLMDINVLKLMDSLNKLKIHIEKENIITIKKNIIKFGII